MNAPLKNRISTLFHFFCKDTVFCLATVLALISMFFVPPSLRYLGYIDFRVLSLLFCLMVLVAGFTKLGIFELLLSSLLKIVATTRGLLFALVFSCFFSSMWITNDVALITFVPFSIMALNKLEKNKLLIFTVVLQTVAANLGSMCTPLGNPQNLYLYSVFQLSPAEFFKTMLPVSVLSFLLIFVLLLLPKKEPLDKTIFSISKRNILQNNESKKSVSKTSRSFQNSSQNTSSRFSHKDRIELVLFLLLFLLSLLTVLHLVPYPVTLFCVVGTVFFLDRKLFRKADHMLLLTFISFFLFVGNIKQLEAVHSFLSSCMKGHEILVSILSSQVISNVPSAVLLSGFTQNAKALFIGTNLGGLGTLIASMASLISYKFYQLTPECDKRRYVALFTGINLLFLAVLAGFVLVFG